MIGLDEDALICDLAETYHIYKFDDFDAGYIATLAAGLRDNARIVKKITGCDLSMAELMEREGVAATEEALRYVARAADGSMRDALSILDQCISFNLGEELTFDQLAQAIGQLVIVNDAWFPDVDTLDEDGEGDVMRVLSAGGDVVTLDNGEPRREEISRAEIESKRCCTIVWRLKTANNPLCGSNTKEDNHYPVPTV